jgi:hypothetical protein
LSRFLFKSGYLVKTTPGRARGGIDNQASG